ncbi:MAG: winged helix-turn-helix domain-containing protein [Desulfurococcales archaeon]|nr:winged helix-turn-helix domain-containing protein [Desulfurococcales archaeon]
MKEDKRLKLLLAWLLEGSRGGATRARIMLELKDNPSNPNQLSRRLGLNYRTIIHHLEVLERHGLVERIGSGYGAPYTLSDLALENWDVIFEVACRVLGDGECSRSGTY